MQLPNLSTPVPKCLALAAYCSRMLDKFPDNPKLVELSKRLQAGARTLDESQAVYEQAVGDMLVLRVDLIYENYLTDRRLRRTQQLAELEDGRKGGRIASQLFPQGSSSITRLQGSSQVIAMQDLEARLGATQDLWPQAASERMAIAEHRSRYQVALHAREAKQREIKNLRAARNAAKERFIHLYAEVMYSVRAEFTYDRQLQELFFDQVRARYSATGASASASRVSASDSSDSDSAERDSADVLASEAMANESSSAPATENMA